MINKETPSNCLVREIKEELNINLKKYRDPSIQEKSSDWWRLKLWRKYQIYRCCRKCDFYEQDIFVYADILTLLMTF